MQPNPIYTKESGWIQYPGAAEVTLFVLKEHRDIFQSSLYGELDTLGIQLQPSVQFSNVEA